MNEIIIKWSIDDVKSLFPNLSDDQCRKVLETVKENHDASIGVNWGVIIETVRGLYG